jgi:PAS domain S-box-containing protein
MAHAAALLIVLLSGLMAVLFSKLRRQSRQLTGEREALAAEIALRNTAAQRLRESERRFQNITAASGDWIWESDAEHRFTYLASDAFKEQAGLSANGAVGKTRWELANGDPARDELWRRHKAELDAHQTVRQFRYGLMTTTGEMRYFVVSGKPAFDANGTFLGYRGTASNETARVEAQLRAEQAETLLRDAMDSLSEGFVVYDSDDRLVLCNEAYRRMYPASAHLMVPGVKFETLVRNTAASGHYPDSAGQEEEWVQNFLQIHNEAVTELETQQTDGRWILVSERRMRNGGLAGLRVDISDLKHARAEAECALAELRATQRNLIRAERMASLSQLTAGVAHEINTPIGTALTAATTLERRTETFVQGVTSGTITKSGALKYAELAAECSTLIASNIRRAAELVRSFKLVAVDQTSGERRSFDLAAYIEEVVRSLTPRLKRTPHKVELDCPGGIVISSYPGALAQVITNLVVNSLVHAYPDGRAGLITLSVRSQCDGMLDLTYRDDGMGIPEANRARVFDPFFTTKRSEGGTGLGLHIVYNIVTQTLMGTITLEPGSRGGTQFTIQFPVHAESTLEMVQAL